MGTPLAAGNLVQLRIWTQYAGVRQAAVNSAWYSVSAVGASAAEDLDFATQMDTVVAPVYKAVLPAPVEYRGCQAYIHSAVPPYPATHVPANAFANAGAGTAGSDVLPTQTCAIIRFLTDRPGPSGRGRFYMPFPPVGADDGTGKLVAAAITNYLAVANEVGVGIAVSAGGRTAVLVRVLVHGKNKLGVYPSPTPVTDFLVDQFWATQKRRGSFGRTNVSPI